MRTNALVLAMTIVLAAALAVSPLTAGPDEKTPPPAAGDRSAPGGTALDATDANAAPAAGDDLEELLKDLSPEDVERIIQTAIEARLKLERQQVAGEIKEGLLYEPDDIDAAIKLLGDKPKNTQADNIDRSIRAFAKVDLHLGKAYKLLKAKKYAEAAQAIEKDLNVQEATYLNAARYTLYARALAAADKGYDAVEAYQEILVNMPDRISFAAQAALDSAAIYEKLQRFTYAAQMYRYAVTNYGLTLEKAQLDRITERLTEYAKFTSDPLGWAGNLMGEVKKRLDATDSGKETQKKEEQIVAVITDLIKTAEEKQCGSCKGGQRQRQKRKDQGECKGQGTAQGGGQGPPKGVNPPSSPARVSAVVPGAVARPTKLSAVHDTSESGDWASLPPRERQRLEQLRKKIMSERYRDIIRDYRTKIAERGGP